LPSATAHSSRLSALKAMLRPQGQGKHAPCACMRWQGQGKHAPCAYMRWQRKAEPQPEF